MPRENTVFCTHCERYLPRKREREHRRLLIAPAIPSPVIPSRLRRVVSIESDLDDYGAINGGTTDGVDDEMDVGAQDDETSDFVTNNRDPDQDTMSGPMRNVLHHRWGDTLCDLGGSDLDSDSDFGSDPAYPRLEDSDDECDDGFIDWKAIEEGSGLSAWDQLGENYETEAATIGMLSSKPL